MSCSKLTVVNDQAAVAVSPLQKKIQDDFLICSVCYNVYTNPKNMDCGHIICLGCIEAIIEAKKKKSSVPCPVCRQKTTLSRKGPSKLPDNFMVMGMISMLKDENQTPLNSSEEKNISEEVKSNDHEAATNDSLVKGLVKLYEKIKSKSTPAKGQKAKTIRNEDSSTADESSDSSSEDDSENSCSDDDSSEEESDGESIGSDDSSDSEMGSDMNDLSQLSFVENDSELTLNSSASYSESSDESSDEYSSDDSDTSGTTSDSDSASASEDEEARSNATQSKTKENVKKSNTACMTKPDKKPLENGIQKETSSKPAGGKKRQSTTTLKDITKTGRVNTKDSVKNAEKKNNSIAKKNESKVNSKNQISSGKTEKPLKSCNGMRIGSEILVFAGKSEPLAVKLHWLEKVQKKAGVDPQVFAGIQLKSKESFKLGISKEFRGIKTYKGPNKDWLKDEKKLLRAVVPINQCIPKNLLQAITTVKQMEEK